MTAGPTTALSAGEIAAIVDRLAAAIDTDHPVG